VTVEALSKPNVWQLVDARAAERFRGEVEPIDPIAGHIAGAWNRPLTENLDGNQFKSAEQLKAEWQALLGNTAVENVVHMCGSGVTACHNLLAMEVAGLTGAKLYAGSWSEWIRDPSRPIAIGG
jgi:thiosulfate/3-mercaptopyruvate sulfurtransferase